MVADIGLSIIPRIILLALLVDYGKITSKFLSFLNYFTNNYRTEHESSREELNQSVNKQEAQELNIRKVNERLENEKVNVASDF